VNPVHGMCPARKGVMRRRSWWPALRAAIRDLNPGYFALVMTTRIVSRAMSLDGASRLSGFLLRTGIVACVLLVAACTWRFAGYRREFLADLGDFEITATKTGPSPGIASSWAAFFTTAGCFTVKVVTPQQFQAYMAAQRTAQSSSGSTQ
jgi:tellurite resistance protein TehA-like permease